MQLPRFGEIVEKHWLRTFSLRKDMNLKMGEYVVMPNHFHAIIGIGKNSYNSGKHIPNGGFFEGRDAMHRVSTGSKNSFGPQSKNLGSIMRGFKSAVTTSARKIGLKFAWQSGSSVSTTTSSVTKNHIIGLEIISYITRKIGRRIVNIQKIVVQVNKGESKGNGDFLR